MDALAHSSSARWRSALRALAALAVIVLVPAAGAATTGATASPPPAAPTPGSIQGRVTTFVGDLSPVSGVTVTAFRPGRDTATASAVTDSNGDYQITGLPPARYQVEYTDPTGAFRFVWYPGAVARTDAVDVLVRSGTTTSADDRMYQPGSVGGVVAGTDGNPLPGISATLLDWNTGEVRGTATSGADGSFTFADLGGGLYGRGMYRVRFRDPNGVFATQAVGPVEVDMSNGNPNASVAATLVRAGSLSGTTTRAGLGVPGVAVRAVPVGSSVPTTSTVTRRGGSYTLTGLSIGAYDLHFGADTGPWTPVWFDGAATQATATAVTVTAGATTTVAAEAVTPAVHLSLVVNTAADTPDAHPGDRICADATGRCSLRAAVDEADANPSKDTITIAHGINPTLTRAGAGEDANATGDLDVSDSLTIHGQGATLDAGGLDRAIESVGGSLTIDHLTVTGGTTAGDHLPGVGDDGGGILALGDLTLIDVTVTHNAAVRFQHGRGGGVAALGRLTLLVTTVSDNTAQDEGGGVWAQGPSTIVANSTIEDNQTAVRDADPEGNNSVSALDVGSREEHAGTATIIGSTVSDNISTLNGRSAGGGGMTLAVTTAKVVDTTITGNQANVFPDLPAFAGGGSGVTSDGGPVALIDDTIADNPGYPGVTQILPGGGVGAFTVAGSIVSGPQPACNGAWASLGDNVFSDASCEVPFANLSDRQPVDPMLGPLAANGGPTQTRLPLTGSSAVDAVPLGTPVLCDGTVPFDQRGAHRPQGSACDVGAVEGRART